VKSAPAVVTVVKVDPPKPEASPSPSSSPSVVAEAAPHAAISPEAQKPTISASDASAPWSVRGLVALAKGDLSSARVYLTRAADAGDPRAFVALADTYDPAILTKLGVVCAPGDSQRAKDYLLKAAAAGVVAAKDRMAALDQNAH
jgi:TPR repeat protein